jgi:peptidyl-prolyl cis-trans isomerase C
MKSYTVLFVLVVLNSSVLAQNDESIVAQIGNEKISAKDFKLRIELSPYIPANKKIDQHSEREFKNDFLYSLLAEKLWAKEAERLEFASSEKFRFFFKPLEDMFVRDALFKREVENKIKLSAKDINLGIQKSQIKLNTQIVSTNDSLRIYDFFNQVNKKNNFDSLLSTFPELTSTDVDVFLGSLRDEEIEDSLYSLEINQFTSPIKSEAGWVIFKIKNKVFTPIDLNDQKAVDKMKKAIRDRRIEKRYHEYMEELLSEIKININPEPFLFTFRAVWNIIRDKSSSNDSITFYSLNESDFLAIINSSSGYPFLRKEKDLNEPLFTLGENKIRVKDFIGDLAFNGFSVNKLDSIFVLQKLARRAKKFVENQIITQEGYKRKLNLAPEVSKDLSLWRQKYLAELYFKSVLDSMDATESEVYDYYINELVNKTDTELINLRIITLTELDEVSKIFDLLKEGKSFEDIIKNYGQTDPLVNEYGETGLKPISLLSDIGKIALQLKLNEVHGPIQRGNAYSIIQVFDKKEIDDSLRLSFESIKDELRNGLRIKKLTERLSKTTSSLAEKYNVKIYSDALNKIEITEIPMFLHRFMGFGGRIAGMPLLTPFSDWINDYELKKILLP